MAGMPMQMPATTHRHCVKKGGVRDADFVQMTQAITGAPRRRVQSRLVERRRCEAHFANGGEEKGLTSIRMMLQSRLFAAGKPFASQTVAGSLCSLTIRNR